MSIAGKSLSIISRDILLAVAGFGTSAVVARTLGPVGIGSWAVIELLINYTRVFGSPRFEIASVYFLGKQEHERGDVLFIANLTAFVTSVGIVLLGLASIGRLEATLFRNTQIGGSIIVVALCYVPIMFFTRNYTFYLLSQGDVRSFNILRVIQEIGRNLMTILLLVVFHFGLWALPVSLLVSGVVGVLYGVIRVHSRERVRWSFNWRLWSAMLGFSYKVYLAEGIGFLSTYLSNLITAVYLPPSAVAFFSMGKGKAEYLNQATTAICSVLYPTIANRNRDSLDSIEITTTVFRISLFLLALVGAVGVALIYPTTIVLYGRRFAPLAVSFWIVIPGVVIHSAANIQRQYFLGIGKPDVPLKIATLPLLLQGLLCYVLIPKLGYVGAAISVSSTLFLTGMITLVVFKKVSGVSYREIACPTRRDLHMILEKLFEARRACSAVFQNRPKKVIVQPEELNP